MAYSLTNNAAGPRGVNAVHGYVEIAPGQTVGPIDLVPAELQSVKDMDCFTIAGEKAAASGGKPAPAGKAPPAPPPAAPVAPAVADADLPSNPLQLKQIAKAEGIDVGAATKGADLKAAIIAGRQAKAAAAGGGSDDQANAALDAMDDDTLRTTVAAITGKSVGDLADQDRDALLALARGE